jgi:hypothetical protein
VQTTSPPDKALLRPLSSSSKCHTTRPYFITLHLLVIIKGACRDLSKGTEKTPRKKNNHHNNTKLVTSR